MEFVPGPVLLHCPQTRILRRPEDVVYVDDTPPPPASEEPRTDLDNPLGLFKAFRVAIRLFIVWIPAEECASNQFDLLSRQFDDVAR